MILENRLIKEKQERDSLRVLVTCAEHGVLKSLFPVTFNSVTLLRDKVVHKIYLKAAYQEILRVPL